jgi:hypothetical protein
MATAASVIFWVTGFILGSQLLAHIQLACVTFEHTIPLYLVFAVSPLVCQPALHPGMYKSVFNFTQKNDGSFYPGARTRWFWRALKPTHTFRAFRCKRRFITVTSVMRTFHTHRVTFSLCLINWTLCHESICGIGVLPPPFLTSALDGDDWSASCRGLFAHRKNHPQNPEPTE